MANLWIFSFHTKCKMWFDQRAEPLDGAHTHTYVWLITVICIRIVGILLCNFGISIYRFGGIHVLYAVCVCVWWIGIIILINCEIGCFKSHHYRPRLDNIQHDCERQTKIMVFVDNKLMNFNRVFAGL